jgi:hypothetical protein
MKIIPLTRGQVALVDDEDYEQLSQHKWCATTWPGAKKFYAVRADSSRHAVLMHRAILGLEFGDKRKGDHIETEKTLDNRRCNLRIANSAQNSYNRTIGCNNTSGFKGVFWQPRNKKWLAQIRADKRQIYLGLFGDPKQAAEAYRVAALKYHGEFARTE